jgi:hypothetical protein
LKYGSFCLKCLRQTVYTTGVPLRFTRLGVLAALVWMAPSVLRADNVGGAEDRGDSGTKSLPAEMTPVEQDVVIEGMASYGNYKIFASGKDCKLYTGGVEYDRHSWGRFLRARMDYVGEILPVVVLNKPVVTDYWGNPKSYAHELVPGLGISPIGFRMLWRDGKAIKPYLSAKGGMIFFTEKVPSAQSTYENFSLQSNMGVNVRMNPRMDLRLGLFGDFHFSNAFIVPSNPGLDVMNANVGISYHVGRPPGR